MDPDKIIDNKDDDLLNRNEFASSLADRIIKYDLPDPLTIGIMGSWGSGKSSLIKLTENILKDEEIIIIHFEPWFFSTQDNLYLQFFKLLISKLKNEENRKRSLFKRKITPQRRIFEKANNPLQDYFNYIKDPSNELNKDNLFYPLNQTYLESYGSLAYHKNQCETYFDDNKYKIIVIIDDIDRLTNKEISQIFTLVKSLANFKHFIYILSFDKEIVTKAINKITNDDTDKFIDKIIQIPLSIPKISESKMDELILKDIGKLYDDKQREMNLNNDFGEIFEYLKQFIRDMRDLKRYKNTLNFYLNDFFEELNINDFFLMLAIHLFEHELYLKIKNNKDELTLKKNQFDNNTQSTILSGMDKKFKKIFDSDKWNYLEGTLIFLFPKFSPTKNEFKYKTYKNWEKNHKICSEKYFEKYFTLSLENFEINEKSLNQLIMLNEVDTIYNFLTHENNLSYNHSILSKFNKLIPKIPPQNYEFFIKALMKAGDMMKIYSHSRRYFKWIFDDLFNRIESQEKCYRILEECIKFYDNNVLTTSEYINSLAFDYGLVGHNENIKSESEMFIEKSKVESLIILTIKKIHKDSENNRFINQPFLQEMLTCWEDLEDKKTVKEYVLEKVTIDNEILSFLSKFQTNGEMVFDFEKLNTYHGLKFYKDKTTGILHREKLDEKTREFCELFITQLNEYKKKIFPLFITYCEDSRATYEVIEKWINNSDINWEHNSVLISDSKNSTSDSEFKQLLDNKIKNSSLFIMVTGMYTSQINTTWINKEIEIAQKYNKPILGVHFKGNEIPTFIQESIDKFVNWNENDFINGIKEILGIN